MIIYVDKLLIVRKWLLNIFVMIKTQENQDLGRSRRSADPEPRVFDVYI
ncbi:hypothetical protein HanIR_Chr02g0060811 [Helianthus annuus]|nr:hypothetical protein HanIR_Chr02g0060811 [Helianthus annuus]